ncbi:MAG TPA: PPOX class F420-dependent oxidoreductase [Pseudonocardia sp.]|jgi:PPOX class probable F420-dependent enzyme|uniref:PPOX class F420-dependent oxidoreductase n=1 Tax=Pseudonocardia sp. TaxID=60912 RepID=UPI002F425531
MSTKTANGPELLPETEELATGQNFAAVSTVLPNGQIQTQVIWVHVEDGQLVLNTETHRAKYLNVTKDPRITVLIRDEQDPYRYAEVRGHVAQTTTGDRARAQIDELAQKYINSPYPAENIKSERVIFWITPERQTFIDQNKGIAD